MLAGMTQQILEQGPNWTEIVVATTSVVGLIATIYMVRRRKK